MNPFQESNPMKPTSLLRTRLRGSVLCASFLLAGCSSWFERAPIYPGAREVNRIEVPSGLVRPVSDPAMSIPPGQRGVLNRREILPPDWSDEQP
jgi:uncharacterized lipoprotein